MSLAPSKPTVYQLLDHTNPAVVVLSVSPYLQRFLEKLQDNLARPERFRYFLSERARASFPAPLRDLLNADGTPASFLALFGRSLAPARIEVLACGEQTLGRDRGTTWIQAVHRVSLKQPYRNPKIDLALPAWLQPAENFFNQLHAEYWDGRLNPADGDALPPRTHDGWKMYRGRLPAEAFLRLLEAFI
jgi:hypothetical protein